MITTFKTTEWTAVTAHAAHVLRKAGQSQAAAHMDEFLAWMLKHLDELEFIGLETTHAEMLDVPFDGPYTVVACPSCGRIGCACGYGGPFADPPPP